MKKLLSFFPQSRFAPAFCAGLMALGLSNLSAEVIFQDSFAGVTNPNQAGWYSQNTGGTSVAWNMATDATLGGNALRNPGGGAQNTNLFKQFSEVTLLTNQSISITLDFHATSTTGQFLVGFFNSSATISSNALGVANPLAGAAGNNFVENISATATSPTYRSTILDSSNGVIYTSLQTFAIGDNAKHSLSFTLTMLSSGLQLQATLDSVNVGSFVMQSGYQSSFDTVRFASGSIGNNAFYINNVTVSTVPEPSATAMVLGGVGLLALLAFRRRLGLR